MFMLVVELGVRLPQLISVISWMQSASQYTPTLTVSTANDLLMVLGRENRVRLRMSRSVVRKKASSVGLLILPHPRMRS